MAHHLSAIKRIRTNAKANLRNRQYRSMLRTVLRKVHETTDNSSRSANLRQAFSVLDRLVTKGILHRNTAARRKSQLQRLVTKQNASA
jgi:small subunit ribosomal protein S20